MLVFFLSDLYTLGILKWKQKLNGKNVLTSRGQIAMEFFVVCMRACLACIVRKILEPEKAAKRKRS